MAPSTSDEYEKELSAIAERLGVPVDAFFLVVDALDSAPQYSGDELDVVVHENRHCTAIEVCLSVARIAFDLWDNESDKMLVDLQLTTGKDVGRIVYALVDAGLIEQGTDDDPNDFPSRPLKDMR